MDFFEIIALILTLTALFSYLNHRTIGLPTTIGVMTVSLLLSLVLVMAGVFHQGIQDWARSLADSFHFSETLMQGMLSFLLFAGALHINLDDLYDNKWIIGSLALFGTLLSAFLVGLLTWWLLSAVGLELPFIYCLIFGALISPTDPIAVLGILKTAGAPKSLETKITGESLFNDGVGVVLFLVVVEIASGGHGEHGISAASIGILFAQEVLGGGFFGLVIGYIAYRMLKSVDNHQVEILITLALVAGGYALAGAWGLSGPIAIVVAGLLIGNRGRHLAMSDNTRRHLDGFWELIDEILNAVLFVLIGLEVVLLTYSGQTLLAGILAIPLVLLVRLTAVSLPIAALRTRREFSPGVVRILTWGGLRGGISVALALSLPSGEERDIILSLTYPVVLFSILVQGLTIGKLIKKIVPQTAG